MELKGTGMFINPFMNLYLFKRIVLKKYETSVFSSFFGYRKKSIKITKKRLKSSRMNHGLKKYPLLDKNVMSEHFYDKTLKK
jgi:hypothetical protein